MKDIKAVVWIHETHGAAASSVMELQRCGFNMQRLSIAGRDHQPAAQHEERVLGDRQAKDRVGLWGRLDVFWGGLFGRPFGSGVFVVPGIGPLVVLGPLVGWLVGALEGAVVLGGLSALGAALYSQGIPRDSVLDYESALKANRVLVMAHGAAGEVARARSILSTANAATSPTHSIVVPAGAIA